MENKKNKNITSRDIDFAKWYTDVVREARLATYSNVKGCVIFEPNGYALWENIQKTLDKIFKETGHQNVAMPMFIPENLLKKEGELIDGFAPEVAWVTVGGNKELEERLAVRPTSETLFSDYYSSVIKSYRDLPMKLNQWCSVVRWEKETRPFLRSREFFWQEGHTVHSTMEEATEETLRMLNVYKDFFTDYLAIPPLVGRKTEKEKFAGAEYTYTIEALMYNGVALQSGTSHYFGQKFSKAYNIQFLNKDNKLEYAYQTSWGVSNRMIGALIMVHGDDNGLVIPPRIAPTQVVIIPIGDNDEVMEKSKELYTILSSNGVRVKIDDSNKTPGFKFADAEVNGIPIRIEFGKRDLDNNTLTLARRDTREKITIDLKSDILSTVNSLIDEIHNNLYNNALERRNKLTFTCKTMEEVEEVISNQPGFIKAMWCGSSECELKMKEIRGTKSRCIPFEQEHISDKCVCCGREAKEMVVWGIQY